MLFFNLKKKIFLFLFFCANLSFASNGGYLKIDNYNTSHGIANSHVLCTFHDSRGLIWVGTFSGVQIFDSYNFELFNENTEGTELFSNHVIYSIAEDNYGNMWFGTEFGLNKYSVKTKTIEQIVSHTDSCNFIRDIAIDKNGLIWLGTYGGGLKVYDDVNDNVWYYRADKGNMKALQSNHINSLFIDNQGLLWISTENGGLTVFDMESREVVRNIGSQDTDFGDDIVSCVYKDYYDNYWIGTWNEGLIKFTPSTNTFEKIGSLSTTNNKKYSVRSIEQTDKDFLWIGTFGQGLYRFDVNTREAERVVLNNTDLKSTKQDFIWHVKKDNGGNIWISTFGSGVFMINKERNTFPSFVLRDLQTDTRLSIASFSEDKNNNLWIGTYNGGVFYRKPGEREFVQLKLDVNLDDNLNYIYNDSKNRLWIGLGYGLIVLMPDRKTCKVFTHNVDNPNSISKSAVNSIVEDDEGNFWIGFWGEGINVLSEEELSKKNTHDAVFIKHFSTGGRYDPISNNNIWKLYKDSKGIIWITSPGQLGYFIPQEEKFNSVEIYSVSSILEDSSGHLWVTSMGQGVYKLDKNYAISKTYNLFDGFPTRTFMGLLSDGKGRLWIGTDKGLSVLEPESGYVMNFNTNYGFEFNEVSLNACLKLNSGEMVFGGNEGFTLFDPEGISQNLFRGKVIINDIRVMHKSIALDSCKINSNLLLSGADSIKLGYNENILSLDFIAINYSNPKGVKYSYRLEGFDSDWVFTDASNRSVTYTNLKPGEYVFTVRASYSNVNWGTSLSRLHIFVEPPFWQKAWFHTLCLVVFLFLLILFVRIRMKATKKLLSGQNKQLSVENLEKSKEILLMQNKKLDSDLNEVQKKNAELTYLNLNAGHHIKKVYNELIEVEKCASNISDSKRQLRQIIKTIEQSSDDLLNIDSTLTNTVNLLFDDFQKRLLQIYPKLTTQDLRLCSYIRLNKSNKEIANLLNITSASLDTSRYRLRKKMKLSSDINLNEYILKL